MLDLLYGVYESWVWVWARGVDAPIRVDLLLLAPLLYVLSGVGVWALWKARRAE